MVFSSLTFLFIFLLFAALLYFIVPGIRLKNAVLLLASLVFYSWAEPSLLVLLLADTVVAYVGGLLISRLQKVKAKHDKTDLLSAKAVLFVVTVLIIGALVYFKYFGFITEILASLGSGITIAKIVLPTGISFYTFQILSYVIDLYRGKVKLQKNFFRLLLYVSFFPQLIAGPIVRYDLVEEEIGKRKSGLNDIEYGLKRFIIGFFKKVILANGAAKIAEIIYAGDPMVYGSAFYWLAALAYTFQIYFDFCGYSDMAIGLGRIFGFHFAENFDYPYLSRSVSEFWSKWHISLSTWFRDYVYIPLGGNRVKTLRWIFNFLCVWLLTGLWHGASYNFILWGLYYAVILLTEKAVASMLEKRRTRKSTALAAKQQYDGPDPMALAHAEEEFADIKEQHMDFSFINTTAASSYTGFDFEAKYGNLLNVGTTSLAKPVGSLSKEKPVQQRPQPENSLGFTFNEPVFNISEKDWLTSLGSESVHRETREQDQIRSLNEMLYGAEPEPTEKQTVYEKHSAESTEKRQQKKSGQTKIKKAKPKQKKSRQTKAVKKKKPKLLKRLWKGLKKIFGRLNMFKSSLAASSAVYTAGRMIRNFAGWLYTMFAVVIGWVLFNLEDLELVGTTFKTMFSAVPTDLVKAVAANTDILRANIFIPLCFVCIFPVKKLLDKLDKTPAAIISTLIYAGLFVLCICFLVAEKYNPFIYFRF